MRYYSREDHIKDIIDVLGKTDYEDGLIIKVAVAISTMLTMDNQSKENKEAFVCICVCVWYKTDRHTYIFA